MTVFLVLYTEAEKSPKTYIVLNSENGECAISEPTSNTISNRLVFVIDMSLLCFELTLPTLIKTLLKCGYGLWTMDYLDEMVYFIRNIHVHVYFLYE